jgi:peptidyl-prolyl cis-trans isomerase C
VDKKTNKTLPFELVRQYIHDYLQTRSLQTGINQYIKILAGKAKIVGYELDGADSPLVQ